MSRSGVAANTPSGPFPDRSYRCRAAIASTTFIPPPSTRPNVVKPPFWLSRLFGFSGSSLSARLKNHWFEALLALPPSFAIAIVPRTLVLPTGPGSLTIVPNDVVSSVVTDVVPVTLKPPPCTTNPGTDRWINVLA